MQLDPKISDHWFATGCAVSGRLVAIATIELEASRFLLHVDRSRLFHLGERSRMGMRNLALEIHQFASEQLIKSAYFCRTLTGDGDEGMADEARVEALMCMIPTLETEVYDEDAVLQWAVRENPPLPENVVRRQQTLAQLRAIELAQFSMFNSRVRQPA